MLTESYLLPQLMYDSFLFHINQHLKMYNHKHTKHHYELNIVPNGYKDQSTYFGFFNRLDYDKLLSILDGARKNISLTSHHS